MLREDYVDLEQVQWIDVESPTRIQREATEQCIELLCVWVTEDDLPSPLSPQAAQERRGRPEQGSVP